MEHCVGTSVLSLVCRGADCGITVSNRAAITADYSGRLAVAFSVDITVSDVFDHPPFSNARRYLNDGGYWMEAAWKWCNKANHEQSTTSSV